MRQLFAYLYALFTDIGRVELNHGSHALEIKTCRKPRKVWVEISDCDKVPVCQGNVNKAGVHLLPHGFILYTDIQSNKAKVKWSIEY